MNINIHSAAAASGKNLVNSKDYGGKRSFFRLRSNGKTLATIDLESSGCKCTFIQLHIVSYFLKLNITKNITFKLNYTMQNHYISYTVIFVLIFNRCESYNLFHINSFYGIFMEFFHCFFFGEIHSSAKNFMKFNS